EAAQLAQRRTGHEGTTGISSPRRYLWDEERYAPGWRFNERHEPMAAAAPLTTLINDEGVPLSALPTAQRLPVFAAHYSRSAVMTLMLSELLAQALMQINSIAQRSRMPNAAAPRRLRAIILTLPSAMPKPEREIFRRRMQEAIGLVWKALGWHPQDAPFDGAHARFPAPQVQMEWDEATCGQMVYLYNETQVNFAGRTDAFFAAMARPDRSLAPGEQAGKTLRIASIDIGGGTTDLAITHYSLDDGVGNNIKINPRLLFREGFKVAGDDILLDAIQQFILPAVQQAFETAGVSAAPALMDRLFGNEGRMDGLSTLRQQAALQIFMPAGRALLGAYEEYDPLDNRAEIAASLGDLLPQPPTPQVLAFINGEVQREADSNAFDILHTPLVIRLADLHAAFLSDRIGIGRCLRLLAEVVALYTCDVLLLITPPVRPN
ncbi:virulence factor SrfB, partial [Serratia marcescens]|uniref:virulence factor SrfB n=1 Tax=Serratia marcescens TaxID=615 RepID=UPI0021560673